MRKTILIPIIACALVTGCSNASAQETTAAAAVEATVAETTAAETAAETEKAETSEAETSAEAAVEESDIVVQPLPDTTMDSLDNATVAISLEEGGAYVDDTGVMKMDMHVYSYEMFDMVDIASLEEGAAIVIRSEEVVVESLERTEQGWVIINGGLENGGYDLATSDSGVYYEIGFDDVKSWNDLGEVSYRVNTEFQFTDASDLDKGEVVYYPGDFLMEETEFLFNFTPFNTTVRIEDGQIVSMVRNYTP